MKITSIEIFSAIISMSAFVASIFAIWLSRKSQNEILYAASIENQYNNFDKFADMVGQNWQFNHLFALKNSYDKVLSLIREAIGELTDEKRSEYLVRERVIALMIFQTYERTLYQYQLTNSEKIFSIKHFKSLTKKTFNTLEKNIFLKKLIKPLSPKINDYLLKNQYKTSHEEFLDDVLEYFTGRLLCNPRLIHYWNKESFKEYLESSTQKHYLENVTPNIQNIKIDSLGPFG